MTPQEKNVFSKLFNKTELGSHKVELALTDEIKGATTGVNNFSNNIDIDIKELLSVKNSLSVDLKDLKSDLNKLKNDINKLNQNTKELGLDPNQVNGYKEALNAIKNGETKIALAEKYL